MRSKASSKGVWLRLRRQSDGVQLWCGSFHFTQGCTKEQHAQQLHGFLKELPPTTLPTTNGGDANTPFKWVMDREGEISPYAGEGKGEHMITGLFEKGLGRSPLQRSRGACRPLDPGSRTQWVGRLM